MFLALLVLVIFALFYRRSLKPKFFYLFSLAPLSGCFYFTVTGQLANAEFWASLYFETLILAALYGFLYLRRSWSLENPSNPTVAKKGPFEI